MIEEWPLPVFVPKAFRSSTGLALIGVKMKMIRYLPYSDVFLGEMGDIARKCRAFLR